MGKKDKIILASASRWVKNKQNIPNDPLNNNEFDIIDGIIIFLLGCVIFKKYCPY